MESANRTETEGNGGEGEGKWKKEMDQIEEMRMKYWGIDFDWLNCRRNRARESRIKNAATAEQKKIGGYGAVRREMGEKGEADPLEVRCW